MSVNLSKEPVAPMRSIKHVLPDILFVGSGYLMVCAFLAYCFSEHSAPSVATAMPSVGAAGLVIFILNYACVRLGIYDD